MHRERRFRPWSVIRRYVAPGTSDSSKWPPVSLRVSTGPGTDDHVTDVEQMTSSVYWKSQVNFVVYSARNVSFLFFF